MTTTDELTPAFVESLLRNSTTEAEFMAAARKWASSDPWPIVLELYRHQRSARILSRFNKKSRDRWFECAARLNEELQALEMALINWRNAPYTNAAALLVETENLLKVADRVIEKRQNTAQLIKQTTEETHANPDPTGIVKESA